MLYKETVRPKTLALIQSLMDDENLKEFFLGGDTALAFNWDIGDQKVLSFS